MEISPNQFSATQSHELIERLFKAPVERHVLPNGLTLVHRPDFSSEVVSVQVWVKTGSIHEDAYIGSGLSHYLEHMLFKGTSRRDGKSISREVHAIGGSINAYTTFDRTVYYIDAPSAAFHQVVDVLSDIVLHSTLPTQEVERERSVILREIDMGLDDPDRQLSQALFRTAFQRHPYREPVIGHRALYEQVTAEELRAYYHARYVPNNMVVSVVGAVAPEECLAEVEKQFGAVQRGRLAPVRIEEEPVQLAARREDVVGEYNIFRGGLGFKVPHMSHPDSPCLDALAHALGGGESSLLWERLRNQRKLVNYIDCRNWNPGGSGLFWISYVCDAEKSREVEQAILDLLAEVEAQGLPESVVEKARRQALTSEINGRKTMSGQASRLGLGEVVIGDIYYGRRYLKRLQAVKPGDLQAAAQRYLVDESMSAVTLGPAPQIIDSTAALEEKLALEPFEQIIMSSGARLLLQPDSRLPKVHLRCVLQGGPLYEAVNQRGISSLLAELLTKDTQRRSASAIAELVESIGGSFSATGGNNTISFAIEVLPADLDVALELLSDALTAPVFNSATFETEREAQVASLLEDDDEILDYGFRKLRERFFGDHPFAVGPGGRVADLKALTAEDIAAHYRSLVRAGNLVLSVTGDFQPSTLVERLRPLLETQLPAEAFDSVDAPAPVATVAYIGHETMEREQAVVLQAYPDTGIQSKDYIVAEVLNELFSGMSSRLFERVREDQGMAYYVGTTRVIGLQTGMFVFYAGTQPEQAEAVVREMDIEIARVAAGEVTKEELARCRTRLKAARPMGKQTIGARAMHAAIQVTYGLPIDDDVEHASQLDQVDAAALARFANTYFTSDKRVKLIVGPDEVRQTGTNRLR
ncbi:MAG TPA: insulinase family protein [Opitutae bacterium]|nr:peptidase M16 [Puniceicoccaceae bacterium]HBR92623.1 insulinase family protein [Opitutae bacterium]|tara:strand:- start:16680 stop:19289 length:2610 start_codon:yes stop_codon:yes gene_type:complete